MRIGAWVVRASSFFFPGVRASAVVVVVEVEMKENDNVFR